MNHACSFVLLYIIHMSVKLLMNMEHTLPVIDDNYGAVMFLHMQENNLGDFQRILPSPEAFTFFRLGETRLDKLTADWLQYQPS